MSRRRLIWQLFPSYLLVTLVAIFAVAWYATYALRASWIDRIAADLEVRAHLVGGRIVRSIDEERTTWLQPLAVSLGTESGARITVLDETGAVLADSDELPKRMESHADRPEFQEALLHGVGRSSRASPTLGENMMYVAVAFVRSPLPTIIVRAALPLTTVDAAIHEIQTRIAFGAALSAIMSAMASLWISRRIARPLREMRRGAARFARGDLKRPLAVPRTEEIASLAEVLNQMAGQLDGHIAELERQRGEREAILASMSEGLVAVDTDERMLIVNRAAATLLGVDAARSLGRSVQEIIRNPDIQRLVKSALARDGTIEDAISFASADGRALEVKASVLIGPGGTAGGAVLVLNDVTHLRRLERVRSDFVANVSHELKTPITAIKGFVETLETGAAEEPADAKRFLGIIARQADRLEAIVDDLLALSRLEQEKEGSPLTRERQALQPLLASAIEVCSVKAAAKQVRVELQCPPDLEAEIAAPLVEQAVVNLIDNAVKYSPSGTKIWVGAERDAMETRIFVRDNGVGISKQHLDRVFERFYRVDKARSRDVGGTGLGLSIVKHIAQSHGGRVEVQSTPGLGSIFTIRLPHEKERNQRH